ncbi:MAG: recombinase RecT [Hyphomicrobiaceae bacterium]
MSNIVQHIPTRPKKQLPAILAEVEARRADLIQLLPSDITFETFMSHLKVATMKTPSLLECTPASVVLSVVQAANDGLLPDGREAAIIVYNRKTKDGRWVKEAQYQQMYLGILKRIRQASEVATIEAHAVYAEDAFDFSLGDSGSIIHKPKMGAEKGPVVAAYAIVRFKDGSRQFDVMDAWDILKIRDRSKGFDPDKPGGAWHTDFAEMAKKTVLKRLGKILPQARGRPVLSGDADDSGADETVDHYPEAGVPEPHEDEQLPAPQPEPAEAVDATATEPTSQVHERTEKASDNDPETGSLPPGETVSTPEDDEVAFWKDKLRMLRSWQSHAKDIVESEARYNEWSAQFEEIPAEVEVEVARIVKKRVDQIKAEAVRNEPSDYTKMKAGQ